MHGTPGATASHAHPISRRELLKGGAAVALGAVVLGRPGAAGPDPGLVFVDIDDTVRQVHGYAKQAAAFGYTRQRGLNIQLATLSTKDCAPRFFR